MELPTWSAGTSTLTITWEPGFFSVSTLTAILAITLASPPPATGSAGGGHREKLGERRPGQLDRMLVLHVGHVEDQSIQACIEKLLGLLGHPVWTADQIAPLHPLGVDTRHLQALLQGPLSLGVRVANDQGPESRLDDGVGVAANRLAMLLQDVDLVADRLRIAEEVAHVGVLGHQLQGPPLAAAADHDRWATGLNGAGEIERFMDPVVAAFEARRFLGEHGPANLERLFQPVEPFADGRKLIPVASMLLLVPGGADPEDGATGRHHVEGRDHLGQEGWVAIGHSGHQGAQPDLRRP